MAPPTTVLRDRVTVHLRSQLQRPIRERIMKPAALPQPTIITAPLSKSTAFNRPSRGASTCPPNARSLKIRFRRQRGRLLLGVRCENLRCDGDGARSGAAPFDPRLIRRSRSCGTCSRVENGAKVDPNRCWRWTGRRSGERVEIGRPERWVLQESEIEIVVND